jgi:hypothetical protein
MREVEDQIRHLADALFEATGPVVFTPPPERERSQPTLYLAIAAALICVLGIGGLIVSATLRNNDSTEVDVLWVSDPLSINLDDAIDKSEQQRIASIGPLLTFDFGSLPTGWEASTNFTATTREGDRAEYWQQVLVTSPDRVKLAVNVNGRLDQGVMLPPDNVDDQRGEPIDVRGQPGLQTLTSVSWIEQDRVRVDIVSRGASGLPDISADLSALASPGSSCPVHPDSSSLQEPTTSRRLTDHRPSTTTSGSNTRTKQSPSLEDPLSPVMPQCRSVAFSCAQRTPSPNSRSLHCPRVASRSLCRSTIDSTQSASTSWTTTESYSHPSRWINDRHTRAAAVVRVSVSEHFLSLPPNHVIAVAHIEQTATTPAPAHSDVDTDERS